MVWKGPLKCAIDNSVQEGGKRLLMTYFMFYNIIGNKSSVGQHASN